MSKERKLLLEWVRRYVAREGLNDSYRESISLEGVYIETLSLLAQPEPKQEPAYYLWHDEVHEEHPTNQGDPDVYPLYLAPPKREPLSEDDIWDNLPTEPTQCLSFIKGVKFAERHHGITGIDDYRAKMGLDE